MTRSLLMAPHIERFDVWAELAQSLDEVWSALGIDDKVEQLKWLRSPINTSGVTIATGSRIQPLSEIPQQNRETAIRSADLLGFRYHESALLTAQDYIKLCRHLAEYYSKDKGTETWTEFLGFCLNTEFTVQNLWTQDYKTFLPEGDPGIGISVVDNGTWYPTTHVVLEYDQTRFEGVHPSQMVQFFNYFANINLVIWMTQIGGTEEIKLQTAVTGLIEISYPAEPETA